MTQSPTPTSVPNSVDNTKIDVQSQSSAVAYDKVATSNQLQTAVQPTVKTQTQTAPEPSRTGDNNISIKEVGIPLLVVLVFAALGLIGHRLGLFKKSLVKKTSDYQGAFVQLPNHTPNTSQAMAGGNIDSSSSTSQASQLQTQNQLSQGAFKTSPSGMVQPQPHHQSQPSASLSHVGTRGNAGGIPPHNLKGNTSVSSQAVPSSLAQTSLSSTMSANVPPPPQSPAPTIPLSDEDKERSVAIVSQVVVVGASVIGKSHLAAKPQIPCQDSHAIYDLGDGWGIAVVCDGAGSYAHSHKGSRFVSDQLTSSFAKAINHFKWKEQGLPDEYEWRDIAKGVFGFTYKNLVDYGVSLGLHDVEQLSCTAIVVVYSPLGLLVAHVGDGRACYEDESGKWHAMIRPFAGDEGGTAFFPTDFVWKSLFVPMKNTKEQNDLIRTCLDVFLGCRVINTRVRAFALMSDGCEDYLYQGKRSYPSLNNKYLDINEPHQNNLNSLTTRLMNAYGRYPNEPKHQALDLKEGLLDILRDESGFKDEQDDKTVVVGILG